MTLIGPWDLEFFQLHSLLLDLYMLVVWCSSLYISPMLEKLTAMQMLLIDMLLSKNYLNRLDLTREMP